ncbi:hypothetical protein AC578_10571 [Pseudocercospora eumusae]|uniref:Uncharacterized protein n=1 Tax=Pseudocercospora eumusae TaxID=321146 RepID=A0A139H5C0_9PEZI|nr:hypothetical protein AC578_10571 [Pseudocercospora eumusae]
MPPRSNTTPCSSHKSMNALAYHMSRLYRSLAAWKADCLIVLGLRRAGFHVKGIRTGDGLSPIRPSTRRFPPSLRWSAWQAKTT